MYRLRLPISGTEYSFDRIEVNSKFYSPKSTSREKFSRACSFEVSLNGQLISTFPANSNRLRELRSDNSEFKVEVHVLLALRSRVRGYRYG